LRTKSSIFLTVCLINFAGILAANAGEMNSGARQKLSDSPVDFKVEQHKAEQKLVFKLGLPLASPPEFVQNASKVVLNTFHQWGATVEKACHDLDHFFKANDNSGRAFPILPKRALSTASEAWRGAKANLTNDGRAKAIAER
jgi:hypothetical protein